MAAAALWEWRDPSVHGDVDPLPPPGAHSPDAWADAVLDYFAKSPFFDHDSLTAAARRGLDRDAASRLIGTREGTYYTIDTDGAGVPLIREVANEAANGRVVRSETIAYYSIVHGFVCRARTVHDAVAASLKIVARHMGTLIEIDNSSRVATVEAYAASLLPGARAPSTTAGVPPAKKRRLHTASAVISNVLAAHEAFETDRARRHEQALAAQQEQLARAARSDAAAGAAAGAMGETGGSGFMKVAKEPSPLAFVDARTGKRIVLKPAAQKIYYTVDGDPRPPITRVVWMPVKRVLKFPLINKGATVAEGDAAAVVAALAVMCDYCGVAHNMRGA